MSKTRIEKKIKVLLELRPALDGFAGIPQEVRLLFRGLRMIETLEVEGMIQTAKRTLAPGTKDTRGYFSTKLSVAKKFNRYSQVIVSMDEKQHATILEKSVGWMQRWLTTAWLTLSILLRLDKIKLTRFESPHFEDFIWRTFFAKTLPPSDFDLVTSANYRVCSVPWRSMHVSGLNTINLQASPRYPRLDIADIDIFIVQTPYPARINRNSRLVVRYHDMIPIFMPHTIPDNPLHQATHFYALQDNVKSGAYFACVSEATRQDLLKLFPKAEERSVTIYNMVSHNYYLEDSPPERVQEIIRSGLYTLDILTPKFPTVSEQENFYTRSLAVKPFHYLLVVSTIEPRKNHLRLLAAWEAFKSEINSNIKLVVVGTLGWGNALTINGFKSWIDRGELFMLNAVPANDLRILYRHAAATVCPSLGEGFDFSGVESMRSGGVTIASDIPVHREIYEDASEYFDPYSTASLVQALKKVLFAPNAQQVQEHLRLRGQEVSLHYLPEKILPRWDQFLKRVLLEKN